MSVWVPQIGQRAATLQYLAQWTLSFAALALVVWISLVFVGLNSLSVWLEVVSILLGSIGLVLFLVSLTNRTRN